jgi:glycosyltransferase involved in cell wall biosynthesis
MAAFNHPSQPELSCVVPFFNEGPLVGDAIDRIGEALARSSESFEIIAVDDGSSDETWAKIRQASGAKKWVHGIQLSRNFGKEGALSAGIAASRGRAVIVLDGDLQHPPEYIPPMVELWRDGYELVSATKTNRPGQGPIYRVAARGFNRLFTRWTGVGLQDATDFRLMDRAVADAFLSLPEVNVFFRGTTSWLGFKATTIPIEVAPRSDRSSSKWSLGKLVRLGLNALLSFTSAPLHLVTLAGIVYLLIALALGAQTLFMWATGNAVTGFTTVILLLLGTGGLVLVGLGVMGEYVARIFDEVKARPRYLVRGTTNDSG